MNWETSKLILAHRGFTKDHPENTLEAIEAAMRLGVHGLEVDLQMTSDGELVLFHDRNFKRLAHREGTIEKSSLSQVREIRLGGHHRIPTLEELLDLVRDQFLLNLEIKTAPLLSRRVETRLMKILHSFHLGPTILVSSFHPASLIRMKKIAPEIRRGYLVCEMYVQTRPRSFYEKKIQPFSLNSSLTMTDAPLVAKTHAKGEKVFVWTVNRVDDMNHLWQAGVDGLFSDRPDLLLIK